MLLTLIAIVTGLDVESFVLPATVTEVVAVTSPLAGDDTLNEGGTVSTLNVLVTVVALFPSLYRNDWFGAREKSGCPQVCRS